MRLLEKLYCCYKDIIIYIFLQLNLYDYMLRKGYDVRSCDLLYMLDFRVLA